MNGYDKELLCMVWLALHSPRMFSLLQLVTVCYFGALLVFICEIGHRTGMRMQLQL